MDNVLTIANGKGGVGKTSIAANLAGLAALAGWRVLAVDLDQQGNLGSDLGYKGDPRNDQGAGLSAAVLDAERLAPVAGIRHGLDVVPGGRHTRRLADVLTARRLDDIASLRSLADALSPVASGYDLVVLDGPPAGGAMVEAALAASRWVLIPVKADEGSLDGLELIADSFGTIRQSLNPGLGLLGVVLFDLSVSASALRTELRSLLESELGEIAPVFDTVIRRSERSAFQMRSWGMLAHEYRDRAAAALSGAAVRRRIEAARLGEEVERYSAAAAGLADDYAALSAEILERFTREASR